MATDKYIGKTNKELIIELIGRIENIHNKLDECRPVCFRTENDVIKLKQNYINFKWIITAAASTFTFLINIIFWVIRKRKGG